MDDDQRARLANALAKISDLLNTIQAADREPDLWEANHVAQALGYAAAGWSFAAVALADKACAPANGTDGARTREADTPTLADLRRGLALVGESMKH